MADEAPPPQQAVQAQAAAPTAGKQPAQHTTDLKVSAWERSLFSFVDTVLREYNMPFILYTILFVIQDLQLFSLSWRDDLGLNKVARYILSPLMWLAETYTLAIHIVSWAVIALFLGSAGFCLVSLSRSSQIKQRQPIVVLRSCVVAFLTVLLVPIAQTFLIPVNCKAGQVVGYPESACGGGNHIAVLVTGGLGGLILVVTTLVSAILFVDNAPTSKTGKDSGRFELWYAVARIVLVILYQVVPVASAAQGISVAILAITVLYAALAQPYYSALLNNLRTAFLTGALSLSAASLAFSFFVTGDASNWVFLGVGLGVYILGTVSGFFLNSFLINSTTTKILRQIDHYNALYANPDPDHVDGGDIKDINKSFLALICQQAGDISKRRAVKEQIKAFPSAQWAAIAVRFIRNSYLDKDAIILVNQMFAIAFQQYPKESSLYLTYVAYLRSYFQFLNGEEYNILAILLRKCDLSFDERCTVYRHQQGISSQSTGEGDGDDQLNYAAFMEYQSIERAAKIAHMHALTELRDFWSGIRANEPIPVVARRVRKMAEVSLHTTEVYETALKRFPDARNMHILYSRFLVKVLNDKEKAAIYQNAGDDLEKNTKEDTDRESNHDAGDGYEKRSEGQSSRTSASKEARLQKQKRDLLSARLALPLQEFMARIKVFTALFMVLLIATVAVCKVTLDSTKSSLDGLQDAMVPRRYTWKIYAEIRELQIFAADKDKKHFKEIFYALLQQDKDWREIVLPLFAGKVQDTYTLPIMVYNEYEGTHALYDYNAYTVSEKLYDMLNSVVYQKTLPYDEVYYDYLKSGANMVLHPQLRFFYDNVDNIYALFDKACTDVAESFAATITGSVALVSALGGLTLAVLIFAGVVLPYRSFAGIYDFRNRVIDLFFKAPRSLVLDFITNCEEELEVLVGEDNEAELKTSASTAAAADSSKKGTAKTNVLEYDFLGTVFIVAAAVSAAMGVTLYFALLTQYVPLTFSFSNKRRTDMSSKIHALAIEVYYSDNTTWTENGSRVAMLNAIHEMNRLHNVVNTNLQPFLAGGNNELYKILRVGGICHRYFYDKKRAALEGKSMDYYLPENRTVVPEASGVDVSKLSPEMKKEYEHCKWFLDEYHLYTWDVMTSSVDTLILRFMQEATAYLKERKWNDKGGINSPVIVLFDHLSNEFAYSSDQIKEAILEIVKSSDELFTIVIFSMLAIAVVFGVITFYIGFVVKTRQSELEHSQLVTLLYAVPLEERRKITELNSFIESGGAILL